jgi:hypothetical protein
LVLSDGYEVACYHGKADRAEGWRRPESAELFSARRVVEGFSAMLDFGQFGVDLDNDVVDIDVRRQYQILRGWAVFSHG